MGGRADLDAEAVDLVLEVLYDGYHLGFAGALELLAQLRHQQHQRLGSALHAQQVISYTIPMEISIHLNMYPYIGKSLTSWAMGPHRKD